MPTRFNGDSAARSTKRWPPVTLAWRGPMHDWNVDVHNDRKTVFLTSKAPVTSILAICLCVIHEEIFVHFFRTRKSKSGYRTYKPTAAAPS